MINPISKGNGTGFQNVPPAFQKLVQELKEYFSHPQEWRLWWQIQVQIEQFQENPSISQPDKKLLGEIAQELDQFQQNQHQLQLFGFEVDMLGFNVERIEEELKRYPHSKVLKKELAEFKKALSQAEISYNRCLKISNSLETEIQTHLNQLK